MMNTIKLTDSELILLVDVIENHEDRGPLGYGWQSDELIELQATLNQQAEKVGV
jgi:hypothetical protein